MFSIGSALCIIVVLIHLVYVHIVNKQILSLAEDKAESIGRVIEGTIFHVMLSGRGKEFQLILEMMAQVNDLEALRLFSETGVILKSSRREEIGQMIYPEDMEAFKQGKKFFIYTNERGEKSLSIVKPIYIRPECHKCHDPNKKIRAILDLHLPYGPLERQLASSRNLHIFSVLLLLFLIPVIGTFFHNRFIDRPLREIMSKMGQVEKGNLEVTVELKGEDELASLGKSFNSMIRRLDQAQKEVEKQHQIQMERADRLASLGELASGIAHEIRNPLAGISSAIQVIAEEMDPQDQHREVTQRIMEEIERVSSSLENILSYSRPTPLEYSLSDLNNILDQALFLASSGIRDLQCIKEYDPKLPQIELDPQQMQQVFLNIILNAIQAMPPTQGKLTLRTAVEGDGHNRWIAVKISDNGEGIPKDNLDKIFQPFFTTRQRGTGLGLSIAQRIIEQHGGTISVESELGKGTTFSIFFPLPEDSKPKDESNSC
jgi:signal transduction histidine kinase